MDAVIPWRPYHLPWLLSSACEPRPGADSSRQVQEMQKYGSITRPGDPAVASYLAHQCDVLKRGLILELKGHPLELECLSRQAIFPSGAGGLPTMKIGFVYRARPRLASRIIAIAFNYRDHNFPGRTEWKEIIALASDDAALTQSSVPSRDRSLELTNYPTDSYEGHRVLLFCCGRGAGRHDLARRTRPHFGSFT